MSLVNLTTDTNGIVHLYDGTIDRLIRIEYSTTGNITNGYWENVYKNISHYYEGDKLQHY